MIKNTPKNYNRQNEWYTLELTNTDNFVICE